MVPFQAPLSPPSPPIHSAPSVFCPMTSLLKAHMRPKPGCFEVKRRRNGGGSAGIGLKKRLISQLKTELSEPSPDDSCDEVISLRYVSLFTE